MKTTVQLDYEAILANTAQPIHLALQFTAPATDGHRERPIAFSIVLDRSGSMAGEPIHAAIRAAKTVVQNLRRDDWFSLVSFNDTAEVVIPLGPVLTKQHAYARIEAILSGGSTNLTGGWMLGRAELRGTPAGTIRRQLLLTDGLLNVGIIEPLRVRQVVTDGLERDGIRTSTLGFGSGYDENLLADLARATNGTFYDANDPEKLPVIFNAELDGLQKITVQNLRLRLKPTDFVDGVISLGGYHSTKLPDGRVEFPIGDLTAEEERVAIFSLSVLPIPLNPATQTPVTTLEGEALVGVEILYDEITPSGISSYTENHTIRVRPTQLPTDVVLNKAVLPWVSAQQAADILSKALARRDQGDLPGAQQLLQEGIARLKAYASEAGVADGLKLLEASLKELTETEDYGRSRKSLSYMSASYCKMSSTDEWVSEVKELPLFKQSRRPKPGAGTGATTQPKA